ncbi:hypothetical protein ACYJ1Y_16150 [Natrialbaceae archaeon A-gly3]
MTYNSDGLSDPVGGWRDTITFDQASEYQHRKVTCTAHHTYVEVDADRTDGVWRCPVCGNESDRAEEYTGGWGLVTPVDESFEGDDL